MDTDHRWAAERVPLKRRCNDVIAAELDMFFRNRPGASWDLATAASVFNLIIKQLSTDTRRRLKRALSKTLIHHRTDEWRAHFASG